MSSFKKFRNLPGNVRFFMLSLALWGIPNSLITSYATLYMLDQGLSASQVGFINSLCFIVKTVLSFWSGYVINRLGRRVTAGMIDLLGWGVYMFMLAFASDFKMFLLAALVNCTTTIGGVATSCFMSEDVSKEDRIIAYNFNTIVASSCSFLVPVSGLLINRFALVPAMRGLYIFACISMSASALCKLFFLKETSVGRKLKAQGREIRNPFSQLPHILKYILGNNRLLLLLSMNILLHFATTVNGLYYVPYLTRHLHFSELLVSFFPFVSTAIGLCVCFFVIPRLTSMAKGMMASIFMQMMGALMLILAAFITNKLAYVCVILWAVASTMMSPLLNTMIANNLKDELRTDVYGVFNTFSMLCMFPAGYLGGALFDASPVFLVGFVFAVYLAGFVLLATLNKKAKLW